ncbi:MAG: DedA family protein [Kiritimatiellae bacterium]|nr:DedA family protein [Kiritimatiellia bacterium]
MIETIAAHLDSLTALAPVWGFPLVFFFMAVESSFIPFPSEVVMIPAGFLAMRHGLSTGSPAADLALAFLAGTLGSIAGAWVNYALAKKLGRPFLHRYGKWFLLKEPLLDRAEDLFRRYGDMTTFVCRLLPVIRQLISIPAGLSGMHPGRFTAFTAAGAGAWNAILLGVGAWFGHLAGDMGYPELLREGKRLVSEHYVWVLLGLAVVVALWALLHRLAVGRAAARPTANEE